MTTILTRIEDFVLPKLAQNRLIVLGAYWIVGFDKQRQKEKP